MFNVMCLVIFHFSNLDLRQKEIWDLVNGLPEVKEFRGLPKSTKDCVPIVRSKDEAVEEVYPISALKRGNGYLLVAGMDTSGDLEANLFAKALHSFCAWFSSQL